MDPWSMVRREKTVQDLFNTFSEEDKKALYLAIGRALKEDEMRRRIEYGLMVATAIEQTEEK